jgi:hypothetical protein
MNDGRIVSALIARKEETGIEIGHIFGIRVAREAISGSNRCQRNGCLLVFSSGEITCL